jgi:pimeloyl-ACP methyl ester carboxylesterase
VDRAALSDDLATWLARCATEGLATSDEGWWDDGVAHLAPWGFDFEAIAIPVQVWHGHQDQFVPFQHGVWLAEHVPGAEAHLEEAEGHLSLLNRVPEIHRWLISHLGKAEISAGRLPE